MSNYKIKFGTDGWREIIGKDFTTANVNRVAKGTASWLINTKSNLTVVIGHDCRFGGLLFMETAACVFANAGIKVIMANKMVSTPMISLACKEYKAGIGVILTASHNPAEYNGFKLKADFGGPALPQTVSEIENLIPDSPSKTQNLAYYQQKGLIEIVNFEDLYYKKVEETFDLALLRKHSNSFIYDAMYGAGQDIFKRILPNATILHGNYNPSFMGTAPEPIAKNLTEIANCIKNGNYSCGLATDGDADRIGFFDGKGKFIDSHHLILLLTQYLISEKGYTGKIVKSFSVSDKIAVLAEKLGIETITTKIGFKYICGYMVTDDVLIGAEESGGIAIKGHLPERDGIWMGLALMEYCLKSGKSIEDLILDTYAITGSFAVERYDLHITETQKQTIVNNCENNIYTKFNNYTITSKETVDGYKFRLNTGSWVMLRASGTEPVLRVYAEAPNSNEAFKILDATKDTILSL